MLKNVNGSSFGKEVLESDKVVLVDFYATWCPPCKMLAPVLEGIASKRADFDIAKVNIDDDQELAIQYRIEAVPTMAIFKNGQVVEKLVGYVEEGQILQTVSKHI